MRYDAYSCIAVFHRDGILEKGRAMSEPTSYIVEIDEMGNPSIKYATFLLLCPVSYSKISRNLKRYTTSHLLLKMHKPVTCLNGYETI